VDRWRTLDRHRPPVSERSAEFLRRRCLLPECAPTNERGAIAPVLQRGFARIGPAAVGLLLTDQASRISLHYASGVLVTIIFGHRNLLRETGVAIGPGLDGR